MKTAVALARLPQWSVQSHLNSGMIDASPLTMEQFGIAYGLDALCKPLEKLDAITLGMRRPSTSIQVLYGIIFQHCGIGKPGYRHSLLAFMIIEEFSDIEIESVE